MCPGPVTCLTTSPTGLYVLAGIAESIYLWEVRGEACTRGMMGFGLWPAKLIRPPTVPCWGRAPHILHSVRFGARRRNHKCAFPHLSAPAKRPLQFPWESAERTGALRTIRGPPRCVGAFKPPC